MGTAGKGDTELKYLHFGLGREVMIPYRPDISSETIGAIDDI